MASSTTQPPPRSLSWWLGRLIGPAIFLAVGVGLIAALGLAQRLGWIASGRRWQRAGGSRSRSVGADLHLPDASPDSAARPGTLPDLCDGARPRDHVGRARPGRIVGHDRARPAAAREYRDCPGRTLAGRLVD